MTYDGFLSYIAAMSNRAWSEQWLGEVPYAEALVYQKQMADVVQRQGRGIVLGLEHPRVITLGLRSKNELLRPLSEIPVIPTNRGGQVTLHNPGQLVIYPIIPIRKWGLGVREYVEMLLQVSENFLRSCNITIVSSNNGIYSQNGKIASIGINIKNGIATHGISINVSNHLADFSAIAPCGVQNQPMDRVAEYRVLSLPEAFQAWCNEFEGIMATRLTAWTASP